MNTQSTTISKISPALLKAQQQMGDAVKDAKNPFFKSSYADLNSVREASIPVLNAAGISVLQPTVFADGKNFVCTMLLHESGEYLSSYTEILSNKPSDPQANGSGISYARRYGLQSFLNIGAVDDDGETATGRTASSKSTNSGSKYAVPSGAIVSNGPLPPNVTLTQAESQQAATAGTPKKNTFRKPAPAEAAKVPSAPTEDQGEWA